MHHRKVYMYINFQQNRVMVDQAKPCTIIYLQNIAICINLQQPIIFFKKSILLDKHHYETYIMYINFQKTRVGRSVIIVHTNAFAKNSQVV